MAEDSSAARGRLAEVEEASRQDPFRGLVTIMRILRGPDGCPWDREQTLRSLRRYVLEEAYEVVQAIDDRDMQALPAELGDLLLQIVFLSQMAAEQGRFEIDDVIGSIADKLIRRHPHVFADTPVDGAPDVVQRWEMLKLEERGGGSVLDDMPASLPALARAEKLGRRAAQLGFDWDGPAAVLDKVVEEIDELREALSDAGLDGVGAPESVEAELGDLLFTVSSLARHLGLSPEVALRRAGEKFERRFRAIEPRLETSGTEPPDPEALDRLWQAEKARQERESTTDDGD